MEEKIVLDKDVFKALSVESRLNILKLLTSRNHTLTEIAKELEYSNSTVKEHLTVMEKAGLVKQIDSGHKWKYYKLTFKGRNVIQPREVKVFFAFIISVFVALTSTLYMLNPLIGKTTENFDMMAESFDAAPVAAKMMAVPQVQETSFVLTQNIPLSILVIATLIAVFALGYLFKKGTIIIKNKEK
jgi:predicted ArsR family transcriptional regulator